VRGGNGAAAPRRAIFPPFSRDFRAVPLSRIAWLTTVLACLLTAILLFVSGYDGYGVIALAIGASGAINLR